MPTGSVSSRPIMVAIGGLLAIVGLAIGYYAPSSPPERMDRRPLGKSNAIGSEIAASERFAQDLPTAAPGTSEVEDSGVGDSRLLAETSEFPLETRDIRDPMQMPQIATDGIRRVWLAWDSRTDEDQQTLFLAHSRDGGQTFHPPAVVRTVNVHRWDVMMRGKPAKRESRLWPRLAFQNGKLLVGWVEPEADDSNQLRLSLAESPDGGQSFSAPRLLASTAAVRPTYVAFTAHRDGRVAASWLDNRHGVQQPFASLRQDAALQEAMVFAGPGEDGVCPCCTTAVALSDEGSTLVAFRNNVDGFRDMWLSVQEKDATEFTDPLPIAGKRWRFDGCPHDGPSMALHENVLHVVWMDAHTGSQRVYHARATVGDWDFAIQPLDANASGSQGHPAIAVGEAGALHVVWDASLDTTELPAANEQTSQHNHRHEIQGSGRAICYASSVDGGKTFSATRKLNPIEGAFQTRPTVAELPGGKIGFAWNELSEQGKKIVWRTAPFDLPRLAVRE